MWKKATQRYREFARCPGSSTSAVCALTGVASVRKHAASNLQGLDQSRTACCGFSAGADRVTVPSRSRHRHGDVPGPVGLLAVLPGLAGPTRSGWAVLGVVNLQGGVVDVVGDT